MPDNPANASSYNAQLPLEASLEVGNHYCLGVFIAKVPISGLQNPFYE